MNFTRAMIDLAKEIRRRAPSEIKPTLKMANPEFFNDLSELFKNTNDAVLKALIKEICELAGDPWSKVLEEPEKKPAVLRAYRGQIEYAEPEHASQSATEKKSTTVRIYRGQIVNA